MIDYCRQDRGENAGAVHDQPRDACGIRRFTGGVNRPVVPGTFGKDVRGKLAEWDLNFSVAPGPCAIRDAGSIAADSICDAVLLPLVDEKF